MNKKGLIQLALDEAPNCNSAENEAFRGARDW